MAASAPTRAFFYQDHPNQTDVHNYSHGAVVTPQMSIHLHKEDYHVGKPCHPRSADEDVLSASCFANLMFLAEMSPDTIVVGRKRVAT
ncbi:hypothetical protein FoTM2_008006 [Fusarium oxysporum f. sp. vasinfectum]|nr:hypothetical protein FoTM2_008006 [Fusarium oxysporum f. sp. vasinfectum]